MTGITSKKVPQVQNVKTPRIFAFIDAENIRNSMETYGYKDLDYIKLYDSIRTSKRIKGLHENKIITLEDLGTLLLSYGEK